MLLNSQGRPYKKGKALSLDFRFSIMVDLLDGLSVTETAIKNIYFNMMQYFVLLHRGQKWTEILSKSYHKNLLLMVLWSGRGM